MVVFELLKTVRTGQGDFLLRLLLLLLFYLVMMMQWCPCRRRPKLLTHGRVLS